MPGKIGQLSQEDAESGLAARRQRLMACGFGAVAGLLWALTVAAAQVIPPGVPTREIVWGRYGVQLLILTILYVPRRGLALVRTANLGRQALRGFMMLGMPVAFSMAARAMGGERAWALFWVGPLIGLGLAVVMLRERPMRVTSILALVATGGAILSSGVPPLPSLGAAVEGLIAAATFGVFLVLTRSLRMEKAATGLFWTAACVFVPLSLVVPFKWVPLPARAVLGVILMGSLWLLVLLALDEALRRAPLGVILPFLLTEVVWTRVLAGGGWPMVSRLGALMVLGAAGWVLLAESRPRASGPAGMEGVRP